MFLGYLFAIQTWSALSCYYNDFGIYNIELFRYTETTFATSRLILFYLISNFGFLIAGRFVLSSPMPRTDYSFGVEWKRFQLMKWLGVLIVGVLLLYIFHDFAVHGIPLLQGINKLEHYQEGGSFERFLVVYGYALVFMLGWARKSHKKIHLSDILLVALIVHLILTANKFSSLLLLLICYFAPSAMRSISSAKPWRMFRAKTVMLLSSAVGLFLLLSFGSYHLGADDSDMATFILADRVLANQGHLWWAVDKDYFDEGHYDNNHWKAEVNGIISPAKAEEGSVGMKYLMLNILGPKISYYIFDKGYLYTMAYPAILVASFSYPVAMFVQLLAGIFLCALMYYVYWSTRYNHPFRALIAMLMLIPYITVLFTGNFSGFFTLGMLAKFSLLAALELGVLGVASVERTTRPLREEAVPV